MHDQIIGAFITAFVGFVGVLTGSWLTLIKETENRKHQVIEKRLTEFYGPMLNLVVELRQREEHYMQLLNKLTDKQLELKEQGELGRLRKTSEAWHGTHQQSKDRWRSKDVAVYDEMRVLFKTKLYLADTSTRTFYAQLISLIELAELTELPHFKNMPSEVLQEYDDRKFLADFDSELQYKRDVLLAQLSGEANRNVFGVVVKKLKSCLNSSNRKGSDC